MSRERLRRDLARLEAKLPPPPPPPPDPRERAISWIAVGRLSSEHLSALVRFEWTEAGRPDEPSDEERRAMEAYGAIFAAVRDAAEESGVDVVACAEDERACERLGVEAVHRRSGDELYMELWHRCWAVEAGESDWLPDPGDLTCMYKDGQPWGVTHERRVKAAPGMARKFAQSREELLMGGADPVTELEEARDIAERLYDRGRGHGRVGRRRGLLQKLSRTGADRADVLRSHREAIEDERASDRATRGWSYHD